LTRLLRGFGLREIARDRLGRSQPPHLHPQRPKVELRLPGGCATRPSGRADPSPRPWNWATWTVRQSLTTRVASGTRFGSG